VSHNTLPIRPAAPPEIEPPAPPTDLPGRRVRLADSIPLKDRLYWSLDDVAALCGVSRRLLERQLSSGRMPPCDARIGRRILFKPATILRWLDERKGGR